MKPHIYIDLDRTAFRTHRLHKMLERCQQLFPSFKADGHKQYYCRPGITNGATYYYDFAQHLRASGLNPAEVYERLCMTELADGWMEHDGLDELVQAARAIGDVTVLTYGEDSFQRFKASLCPSLAGINVVTTLAPKGESFDPSEENWLIDDKPIGDELPRGTRLLQVALEDEPDFTAEGSSWPVFNSLVEVKEYISEAMH